MNTHDAAGAVLSGAKPKGKARVKNIHLRRADGGGYISRHETAYKDGTPGPPSEQIHPNLAHYHAHVDKHMPEVESAEEDAGEGGQEE